MARPFNPKNKEDKRITPGFIAQAGKGRPKGIPNKNTMALKDMILKALDGAGGADYLIEQSGKNPSAFLALVGKVLPLQVHGDPDHPHRVIHTIQLVGIEP